jgi:hypothetical protein
MFAYLFWHRPRMDADRGLYEEAQRAFHASLETTSACFRVAALPFDGERDGYEDWYLVESWEGLGELNRAAVDSTRRPAHDHAASAAVDGWGGVYALIRGPASIPAGARWLDKPRGEPRERFVDALPESAVWQRQMVLGPAPEFCVAASEPGGRVRVWPNDP